MLIGTKQGLRAAPHHLQAGAFTVFSHANTASHLCLQYHRGSSCDRAAVSGGGVLASQG